MQNRKRFVVTSTLLICIIMAIAGCGSAKSNPKPASAAAPAGGAGAISHDEGTLVMSGTSVELVEDKGVKQMFTIGTTLQAGELAALVASGEKVRLFHHGTVAVRVEKAPTPQDTALSLSGTITQVSATGLGLKGAGGVTNFVIRPGDKAAFDVDHLKEHQRTSEPTRIYYEIKSGTKFALAYEDA